MGLAEEVQVGDETGGGDDSPGLLPNGAQVATEHIATSAGNRRYELACARKYEILKLLVETRGRAVSFGDITTYFDRFVKADLQASRATLHDDLNSGLCDDMKLVERRARDRYELASPIRLWVFEEGPYSDRRQVRMKEKVAVARACIETEREGSALLGQRSCIITQGTSTEPLFKLFPDAEPRQRPQHVITNSLPGILDLLTHGGLEFHVIGGRAAPRQGALVPLIPESDDSGNDDGKGKVAKWLRQFEFNTIVLSCSSISPDGAIYCADGMTQFRRELIRVANREETVELIILADLSKLGGAPVGAHCHTVDWKAERHWLFVDKPKSQHKAEKLDKVIGGFRKALEEHFVLVDTSGDD
jgi:DeoR/GlpR family transcriptional regulator of sugar metabolism